MKRQTKRMLSLVMSILLCMSIFTTGNAAFAAASGQGDTPAADMGGGSIDHAAQEQKPEEPAGGKDAAFGGISGRAAAQDTKASQADYNLTIDGVKLTADNASDVLGNGIFSYDAEQKTLTIGGNATSYTGTDSVLIENHVEGLVISVLHDISLSVKARKGVTRGLIESDQPMTIRGKIIAETNSGGSVRYRPARLILTGIRVTESPYYYDPYSAVLISNGVLTLAEIELTVNRFQYGLRGIQGDNTAGLDMCAARLETRIIQYAAVKNFQSGFFLQKSELDTGKGKIIKTTEGIFADPDLWNGSESYAAIDPENGQLMACEVQVNIRRGDLEEGKTGGCGWFLTSQYYGPDRELYIYADGNGSMPDFKHYSSEAWVDASGNSHDSDVPWKKSSRAIRKIVVSRDVKNIGAGAFYESNHKSTDNLTVSLPSGIRLGDYAFHYRRISSINMTAVSEFGEYVFKKAFLPESIQISAETVGARAFANVNYIKGVTFSSTVRTIGESAFAGSSDNTAMSIWLPQEVSIGAHAFEGRKIESINLNRAAAIGAYAFYKTTLPEELQISAAKVGDYAFGITSGLSTLVLNASVKELAEGAFFNSSARDIHLGSGVRTVGAYAFAGYGWDYRVDPMQIPATIENIGEKAFGYFVKDNYDQSQHTTVYSIGNRNRYFVIYTKAGSAAEQYGLENEFEVITGNKEFYTNYKDLDWEYDLDTRTLRLNCYTYKTQVTELLTPGVSDPDWLSFASDWGDYVYHVVIGDEYSGGDTGFTGISDGFKLFPNLMDVTVVDQTESLTTIEQGAFEGLKKLWKVTLNDAMESIGERAFADCTALQKVDCGKTLYEIGAEAFSGCTSLTDVTFSQGLETVADKAFENCGFQRLDIGNEEPLSVWENYVEIWHGETISFGNEVFSGCVSLTEAELGPKVKVTGTDMFMGCQNLKTVNYSDQLTELAPGTFRNCSSFEFFAFQSGLTVIGQEAFLGTGVNDLFIPAQITEIGNRAFGFRMDGNTAVLRNDAKLYVMADTAGYTYASSSGVYFEVCDGGALGNVIWRFNETTGELTISGVGEMPRFNGNYTTAPWTFCASDTKSITIGDGITLVSREAFGEEYYHLESVTFGSSVETIQAKAFYNCKALTDVTIPETALTIGNKAFGYLQNIYTLKDYVNEAVTLHVKKDSPAEEYAIEHGFSYDYIKTVGVTGECTYEIDLDKGILYVLGEGRMGSYDFSYQQPWLDFRNVIKYVSIGDGVMNVGKKAFMCLDNLTGAFLSETVTEIEEGAFANDPSLTQLYIPDSVTSIAERSVGFSYTYIDSNSGDSYDTVGMINNSFKLMYYNGSSAFWTFRRRFSAMKCEQGMEGLSGDCYWSWNGSYYGWLTISPIGSGICSFESEIYPWERFSDYVKEVYVEPGIETIPNYAFAFLPNLETAYLNYVYGTVTSIGQGAFEGCQSLKTVHLPWRVTELRDSIFYGCISLESVELYSVRIIGNEVFSGCTSLSDLNLGSESQLESIGESAFYGTALESFAVPEHLYSVGPYAFCGTPLTAVDLPRTVTDLGAYSFGYRLVSGKPVKIEEFAVTAPEGSAGHRYAEDNGFAWTDTNSGWLDGVHWKFNDWTGALVISGEGPIPDFANANDTPWYRHSENIRSISIEDGVTAIGENAFSTLGDHFERIQDLKIAGSVKTIGSRAFAETVFDWVDLVIPPGVESIGEEAFYGTLNTDHYASITLPFTLREIGDYAFVNTGETSMEIPDSVTSIGERAIGLDNFMGYSPRDTREHGDYIIYGSVGSEAERYARDFIETWGWGLVFEPIEPVIPEPQGHVHEMIEMAGKEPTTQEEGRITYYVCADCGEWFEDPDGEIPIEDHDSVILPKIPYISKTEATIQAGKTLTLTVTNAEVTKWASSKTAVAKVSSAGKVTAVAPGKCTIAATLEDGSKLKCTVTVVQISKTTATIAAGKTVTLTVEGMEVSKWTSSDKAIATVGSTTGKVKGVAPGTATITATLADGTKLTCKVTVVKISKTTATLAAGKALTLKVSGMKVKSWASSAKTVATVTSAGKVTALKKGTAKITATLTDGTKLICTVTVTKNPTITVDGKAFKSTTTYSVKKGSYLTIKVTGKAASVKNVYATTKATVAKVISANTATTIKIKGIAAGTATVTIKINGVAFKIKVKVTA